MVAEAAFRINAYSENINSVDSENNYLLSMPVESNAVKMQKVMDIFGLL